MKKLIAVAVIAILVAGACLIAEKVRADEDKTKELLKQGILGAGVGAISAKASKGKAGQGALIGAGSTIVGSAILDAIFAEKQQKTPENVPVDVTVEDIYQKGFQEGFQKGYQQGFESGKSSK